MATKLRLTSMVAVAILLSSCVVFSAAKPGPTTTTGEPTTTAPTAQPAAGYAIPVLSGNASSALGGDLESIYQQTSASVVFLDVIQKVAATTGPFGGQAASTQEVSGSGFIWDTSGHIVTNDHVVANATSVTVTFKDGTVATGKVVGEDPASDLAVVQVNVAASVLHPVTLGNSDAVQVGQVAIVIGYPFALDSTMTFGIVSGLSRLLPVTPANGTTSYSVPDVIQTDAPINPGNSGGVLLNDQGQVIGVPSANISTSGSSAGIGFAIPSKIVAMEIPALIANGSYPHAYLGILGGTLTPAIATAMNLPADTKGVLLEQVTPGGPAANAGLRGFQKTVAINGVQTDIGGDIITAVDGNPVNNFEDMVSYMFLNKKVGDKETITYLRNGTASTAEVTLSALPAQ